MAPTLMGRHKDLVCPKCGCPYQVSASEEVDPEGGVQTMATDRASRSKPAPARCAATRRDLEPRQSAARTIPRTTATASWWASSPTSSAEPQRWDVIVFKYPGDAPTNFIKRLVGLPGETIRIQHGDIWVSRRRTSATADADSTSRGSRRKSCWPCSSRCSTTTTCRRSPSTAGPPAGIRMPMPPAAGGMDVRRLRDVSHRRHGGRRELAALPSSGAVLSAMAGRRQVDRRERRMPMRRN